ncbi:MAG: Mur ligase family protein [Anaplasma sp.]
MEGILAARLEIFNHVKEGATAILIFDSGHYGKMRAAAEAKCKNVISLGITDGTDIQMINSAVEGSCTTVKLLGQEVTFHPQDNARHLTHSAAIDELRKFVPM